MTKLLVPVFREGNARRIQTYFGLLKTFPGLIWMAPDLEVAELAARLRATYGLKTPDAIQAASAVHAKAYAFLTLVLDELL